MKWLLYFIPILFISVKVRSQSEVVRDMGSKRIGKDSVIIYFDKYYNLIEPGCADIIRYGHFNFSKLRCIGHFKDVSARDSSFVISEGNYSKEGLKEGEFVIRYLNGTLQARGQFKNDNYDGEWVFYYFNGHIKEKASFKNGNYDGKLELYNEDGSPKIFMNITGDQCAITDFWAPNGKKIIDKGNGSYVMAGAALPWEGNLANGLPVGIWSFQISDVVYGNEIFDKGKFVKGYSHNTIGANKYSDRSRIHFLPDLPKLVLLEPGILGPGSNISCDGINYRKSSVYKYRIFNNNPLQGSSKRLSGSSFKRSSQ